MSKNFQHVTDGAGMAGDGDVCCIIGGEDSVKEVAQAKFLLLVGLAVISSPQGILFCQARLDIEVWIGLFDITSGTTAVACMYAEHFSDELPGVNAESKIGNNVSIPLSPWVRMAGPKAEQGHGK